MSQGRIFQGWYVALAGGLVAFVAWGIGFYQLGVLLNVFRHEHGWSLTALSLSATIYCLIVGTASLLMGPVVDRHGPRVVIALGAVILSLGMLGAGQVRSLWHVYAVVSVLAVGFTCTSTLVLGAVIARWFVRRRAFVMTITLIGAPLGALLLVPLSSWLLQHFSITTSTMILAVIPLAVILPAALLVIRNDPAGHGWLPDGDPPGSWNGPDMTLEAVWSVRQALHAPAWWLMTLAFSCIMFGQVAFLVHQVNIYRPVVGLSTAALLVGITGAFGIASRLLGWLGDRFPKHVLLAGFCGIQSIAFLLTAFTSHLILLAVAAAVVGLAMGNVVALQPLLMAERFGLGSYGTLFGAASLLTQLGSAAGIFLVGFLADVSGGYGVSLSVCGLLALLAATLAVLSGRPGPPGERKKVPVRSGQTEYFSENSVRMRPLLRKTHSIQL